MATPDVGTSYYTSLPEVLGFWEAEGLTIESTDLGGSGPVVQGIDAGTVDVGHVGVNSLLAPIQQGLSIIGFYSTVPVQYAWPAVLPDSPIRELKDFNGSKIGVPSLESATVPNIKGQVSVGGGDPDSLQFIAVGTGADALLALQNGDVDALMLWDAPYALIEEQGQELRLIQGNDTVDAAGLQSAVIASNDELKERPDAYVAFARGVAKALVFARANPVCAVYGHWEAYPASRPSGVDEEDAVASAVRAWEARMEHTPKVDDLWGFSSDEHVEATIELQELGGVVEPGLSVEEVVDWSHIEEINDFDEAEVEKLAEDCDFPWAPGD